MVTRRGTGRSSSLTVRVALFGGFAVLLFAILLFRLWVLQVLQADAYVQRSVQNGERTLLVPAARGRILDSKGRLIAVSRPSDAVTLDLGEAPVLARACAKISPGPSPPSLPIAEQPRQDRLVRRALAGLRGAEKARRKALLLKSLRRPSSRPWAGCSAASPAHYKALRLLSKLASQPLSEFEDSLHRAALRSPFEAAVLVDRAPRELVFYVGERQSQFPAIRISKRSVRQYPRGTFLAHVFGDLTEIDREQLADKQRYPDAEAGDLIGRGGLEGTYDRWLRGVDGKLAFQVDAVGEVQGSVKVARAPVPGRDLRLTIDNDLQQAAEEALDIGIDVARRTGHPKVDAGAVVLMDIRDGSILAMASAPDFNPNALYGRFGPANRQRIEGLNAAFLNRAVTGEYPAGSTFKPATAVAAVQAGLLKPDENVLCDPFRIIDGQKFRNYESEVNERMSLAAALEQSCDTYFYDVGQRMYVYTQKNREPQPFWARKLGFGELTGVDLPSARGRVPDARFKATYPLYRDNPIYNLWTSGDAVQMAIGQGDLLVTPLQVARLYALIANGGKLVTPHIADRIEGRDAYRFSFPAKSQAKLDPILLATIQKGLENVVHGPNGTARRSFAGFPVAVAGKTGTAEKARQRDFAWFAGYAPAGNPQVACVAIIEGGGKGSDAGAAVVRHVLAKTFGVLPTGGTISVPRDLDGNPIPVDLTQMAFAEEYGDPTDPGYEYALDVQSPVDLEQRKAARAAAAEAARQTP